jgi:hypothetical protein
MRALTRTISNKFICPYFKANATYLTNVCTYSKTFVMTNRQYGKRKAVDLTVVLLFMLEIEGVDFLLQSIKRMKS